MIVIRLIGFERALGDQSVRHVGDGRVLLTNPMGMFLWSIPFLAVGLVLIAASVQLWRHGKTRHFFQEPPGGGPVLIAPRRCDC